MLRGRRRQFLSVILMLIIDTCREESERKSKQGDDSVVVRVTTDDKSECQVRSHVAQSQSFLGATGLGLKVDPRLREFFQAN